MDDTQQATSSSQLHNPNALAVLKHNADRVATDLDIPELDVGGIWNPFVSAPNFATSSTISYVVKVTMSDGAPTYDLHCHYEEEKNGITTSESTEALFISSHKTPEAVLLAGDNLLRDALQAHPKTGMYLPFVAKPETQAINKKNMPDWAREEMVRRGIDPNRPLNDIDMANPTILEALKHSTKEPTFTPDGQLSGLKQKEQPGPLSAIASPIHDNLKARTWAREAMLVSALSPEIKEALRNSKELELIQKFITANPSVKQRITHILEYKSPGEAIHDFSSSISLKSQSLNPTQSAKISP
jgi:hypothetical protein